jgi:hypothetical protein
MMQNEKSAKLAAMAQERAREKGVSYRVALSDICAEHPGLASDALYESRGVMLRDVEKTGMAGSMAFREASGDPDGQIVKMAEDLAKSRSITFSKALAEVAREHPELVRRYREAVMHTKL